MAIATMHKTDDGAARARAGGRDWRSIIFRGAAALLLAMLALLAWLILLGPWTPAEPATAEYVPELHLWHDALIAAYGTFLVGGSLLAALPRPRRTPLLAQFALLALGILVLLTLQPLNAPALIASAVMSVLVLLTYPAPRALLAFAADARASGPLLALATATAVPLLLDTWTNLRLQRVEARQHAIDGHWHGAAAVTLTLALAGFLVASRRPGWRALGVATGLAYLYLGAAALALPAHDGSWAVRGGILALLAGAAYLALTALESRRTHARGAVNKVASPVETPALP